MCAQFGEHFLLFEQRARERESERAAKKSQQLEIQFIRQMNLLNRPFVFQLFLINGQFFYASISRIGKLHETSGEN